MARRRFAEDDYFVYCLDSKTGFTLKWSRGGWSVSDDDFQQLESSGKISWISETEAFEITHDPDGTKLDNFLKSVHEKPWEHI